MEGKEGNGENECNMSREPKCVCNLATSKQRVSSAWYIGVVKFNPSDSDIASELPLL